MAVLRIGLVVVISLLASCTFVDEQETSKDMPEGSQTAQEPTKEPGQIPAPGPQGGERPAQPVERDPFAKEAVQQVNQLELSEIEALSDESAMGRLVSFNIDPNPQMIFGAAFEGHTKLVALYLAAGVDIEMATENGDGSPLVAACNNGQLETAKYLASRGADREKTIGRTSLTLMHIATESGSIPMLEWVLGLGYSVDEPDGMGMTPLMIAAARGDIEQMRWLLERGADLQATMDAELTPMHWVARQSDVAAVRYLTEQGANPDAVDSRNHWTPVSASIVGGEVEVFEYLIGVSKNLDCRDARGYGLLHLAVERDMPGYIEICLEHGLDINDTGATGGATPLLIAVSYGLLSAVELLLEKGADPAITDDEGLTALEVSRLTTTNTLQDEITAVLEAL